MPLIPRYPDVTARAEALVEATEHELLHVPRMDPDMPLPPVDRRTVRREDLLAWITQYWPDDLDLATGRPGRSPRSVIRAYIAKNPNPSAELEDI